MNVRCLNCMQEYEEEYGMCPSCGHEPGAPQDEPYMLPQGTVLAGRYVVGTSLGCGGFANTYKAWDTKLETVVAIKEFYYGDMVNRVPGRTDVILLSSRSGAVKQYRHLLERFLEEARYTAKFNQHENIIHIYEFFEENQTAYYVMEYMEGMDLSHYLRQEGGSLGVEDAITILLSVIGALKAVHGAGIIHRDISPDNIFLLDNGKVKLFDFGLAKFSAKDTDTEVNVKPGYAPPEQYDAKSRQGAWTDIYALGATMYRAITGVLPQESVMRRDEKDELLRPREINPEIPEYIDACLTRAMSLEPAFRFKTVEQFEEILVSRRVVRSEKEEQSFRKKVRIATVSIVSAVILIGAMISYGSYRQKQTDAMLEAAEVLVWVPVAEAGDAAGEGDSGKAMGEEEVMAMYQAMCQEFLDAYRESGVTVQLVAVPEGEYASRLAAAPEGERPDLYRTDLAAGAGIRAAPLDKTIALINRKDYYFLSGYEEDFPDRDSIPLGVMIPLVYGNSTLVEKDEAVAAQNSQEDYYGGKAAAWIGSSAFYRQVQEQLPGVYMVMPVPGEAACSYVDCWSVNGASDEAKTAAAGRLLYYWLGEVAQDQLYIQHVGALPINRKMMDVYRDVNGEMDFLGKELEDATATLQDEEQREAYCQELYQREFVEQKEALDALRQQAAK